MEKLLQRNVGFFFIAVLIITLLGFFPSYFSRLNSLDGLTWADHFHAVVALVWIGMLIAQAFLIRAKKYEIHRRVGKASYFVMPLLLVSFFFIARARYLSEADALAVLSRSGLPDIVYFSILYSLGIIYKNRPAWHIRFFTCIGLAILGPGLGRFAFIHLGAPAAGAILGLLFVGVPLIWLIVDLFKKQSPVPLLIFWGISLFAGFMQGQGHSGWWQSLAKFIADNFF
jgi:uncharacterized membrane protein YozB (DUF420 family)